MNQNSAASQAKGLLIKMTDLKNRGRRCLPNLHCRGRNSPSAIFKLLKGCSHRVYLSIEMISLCSLLIECAQYRKQFNSWFLQCIMSFHRVDMLFDIDHFLPLSAWSLADSMLTVLLWYQRVCSERFTDYFQSVY